MPTTACAAVVAILVAMPLIACAQDDREPGPPADWPQNSGTAPYINAADYGPQPASREKMKTEEFGENPDCTDALQQALDAGAGGTVYIPAAVYRITRPLVVHTGTQVMGAGYCATVISTEKPIEALLHLRQVHGPMTIIRDLWACGPVGGNWETAGIWLEGCNGVTIRDCWVSALQTGIRVDGGSDIWLRNVVFELNHHGIRVECPELHWASGNLRMIDCYGYQNYFAGISIENWRGVQMQSCSATGSAYALLAKGCAQMTLTGFQVNWDRSNWRKFGIRLEDCDTVTLSAGVIEGMLEYGLAAAGCKRLSLSGNVVRNTTDGPGIALQGCELATVIGNIVEAGPTGEGLLVGDDCKQVELVGNLAGPAPPE